MSKFNLKEFFTKNSVKSKNGLEKKNCCLVPKKNDIKKEK
jgi:hypothetical protein